MPVSRGSIHHSLVEDVIALGTSMLMQNSCHRPPLSRRENAERTIATYFEVKYSVLLPYARTCFYSILKSLNLPSGTEVLMTPFNISPMLHIVYSLGLKPKFIDINLSDFGPKYEELERALSERPGCFLLTYLFGSIPNIRLISDLCKKYQVFLIEDISQGIGGTYENRYLGTFGDVAIYSASITKYVDGYNGAFILTNDDDLYKRIKLFSDSLTKPSSKRIRLIIMKTLVWNVALSRFTFNLITFPTLMLLRWLARPLFETLIGPSIKADFRKPLPEYYFEDISLIQTTAILASLEKLKDLVSSRRKNASHLIQALSELKAESTLEVVVSKELSTHSSTFWQFVAYVGNTKRAQDSLFSFGIETGITNLPDLASLCRISLENAMKLKSQYIFLPLHSHLKTSHYKRILRSIL